MMALEGVLYMAIVIYGLRMIYLFLRQEDVRVHPSFVVKKDAPRWLRSIIPIVAVIFISAGMIGLLSCLM